MSFSPIRSKLLSEEVTPAKIVVSCEINGWMETNRKSPQRIFKTRKGSRNFVKKTETGKVNE